MGVRLGAVLLLLWTPGVVWSATSKRVPESFFDGRLPESSVQKSTKDKIYTREQATRGGELYLKACEHCHTPEKVPAGKKPGPPVKGDKFFEVWADRPLGELYGSILNTMPSDGTMVLTNDQTLDLIAYIMQINGMPEGTVALKNDEMMKTALIVK